MIFLLITVLIFLIPFCLIFYILSVSQDNQKRKRNPLLDCETFKKIDKLTKGLGKYKPEKIIVGKYYWNDIPDILKYKPIWSDKNHNYYSIGGHGRHIQTFERKKCVNYKGMKILLDEEDEYKFDVE